MGNTVVNSEGYAALSKPRGGELGAFMLSNHSLRGMLAVEVAADEENGGVTKELKIKFEANIFHMIIKERRLDKEDCSSHRSRTNRGFTKFPQTETISKSRQVPRLTTPSSA
jgi:hypothetical protein